MAGFNNARDIGGLPLHAGGTTVHGAVVRSETPTDYRLQIYVGSMPKFSRVLDLRPIEEAGALAHPFADDAAYRLRPLIDPDAEAQRDPASESTLGAIYRGSLRRNGAMIAAITLFEHIDNYYGGVGPYFCTIGLDGARMSRLRARLLTPAL
ncbi:hypothetical protein GCM10027403_11620 [Arthrobacter tecti]